MKDQITFDLTDAASTLDSDKILSQIYEAATGNAMKVNADGSINSQATISATDLDIRDLVFATDKVDVSGSEVSLDAATLAALETITVEQGTSPWVVGATQLDIDDLNATDDAVQAWCFDGTGNAIGSTTGSLDVNVTNSIDVDDGLANTALKAVAETVGVAAAAIVDGADELAARKYLLVYNNSNKKVFLGPTGITTATGYPLSPGGERELRIGDAVDVFMIGKAAGQDVRTLQMS